MPDGSCLATVEERGAEERFVSKRAELDVGMDRVYYQVPFQVTV